MRALVVEDNSGIRDVIATFLQERGHDVCAFPDAESAWAATAHEHLPLAVLDWGLPGIDGVELCRRLRARPGGDLGAIVMLTGRADPEDIDEVVAAGANDYITKPFKLDWLAVRIAFAERQALELAARARTAAELRRSEARFRSLVQNASDVITVLDAAGNRTYVSPSIERALGVPAEALLGTNFLHDELRSGEARERARQLFAEALARPGQPVTAELPTRAADGALVHFEVIATNFLGDPSVAGVVLNARNISDRRRAEEQLRGSETRYRALVEQIPALIYIQEIEDNGRLVYISPQVESMTGWTVEECLSDAFRWQDLLHPDDIARAAAEDSRTNATGEPFRLEYRQRAKDGRYVWMRDDAALIRDGDGRPLFWQGVMTDVTERRRAEEALVESQARYRHLALHDPLTGLPNRTLFHDRLEHALAAGGRRRRGLAVLFLDLDGFKLVNDTLGHEAGDRLLVVLGERLRVNLRPADTVARLGGDEFAVLLGDHTGMAEAEQTAHRLLEAVRVPICLDGQEVSVGASVGVAFGRCGKATARELLRNADIALYEAKASGRGAVAPYEARMAATVVARLQQENDLRRAIEREELRLHYQPIRDLRPARTPVTGVEALLRWAHPEQGLLLPAGFIRAAEASGQVVQLGAWVLDEACRQARLWQETLGERAPVVGVNLSARQLQEPELAATVAFALEANRLRPELLELEITESVVVMDGPRARRTLAALKELGVRLAIDDFGTGYASFTYLREIPVDGVKIDRSFVAELGRNRTSLAIVRAITALAHDLGLDVTAEGIETAEQEALLQSLGVDRGQGYFFAHPSPATALEELLGAPPRPITELRPRPERGVLAASAD